VETGEEQRTITNW